NAHDDVDATNNQITFASNHNLTTGQAVVYHSGNSTSVINPGTGHSHGVVVNVGGLTDGQVYYVIVVDAKTIQLALTPGGSSIPLSPISSPTTTFDSFTTARSFAQSALDIANNQIDFTSNPGFADGQAVVYNRGSGSAPIGLTDGQVYYVELV